MDRYAVGSIEADVYTGGYRVYIVEFGFHKGKVADFGDSPGEKVRAHTLCEKLNKEEPVTPKARQK